MHGVRKLFEGNWSELISDKDWDLYISEYAEQGKIPKILAKVRQDIKKALH